MIMNTARLMSFTKFLHVDFSSYKIIILSPEWKGGGGELYY